MDEKDREKIRKGASESAKALAKTPEFKDKIIRANIQPNKRLDVINNFVDHIWNINSDDYNQFRNVASQVLDKIYDYGFVDGYKSDTERLKELSNKKFTKTQKLIEEITTSLKDLLFYKNENYGDSALHPEKGFSKLDAAEGILVRLNDKYSRIKNNKESPRKNDIVDFMGYLTLYCAAMGWVNFDEFKD